MAAPSYVYDLLSSESLARWGATSPVGTPVTITYRFPTSPPAGSTYPNFTPFTTTEINATRSALAYISSITGLRFVETSSSSAQLEFGNGDLTRLGSNVSGRADYTYTSAGIQRATVFLSNTGSASLANSNFVPGSISSSDVGGNGWNTLLHEIGHALGLKHPFERNIANDPNSVLPANQDNISNSIMSYTAYQPSNVAIVTGNSNSYSYTYSNLKPQTFSLYDIAALQYLYGLPSGSTSRKTFSFSPNAPILQTIYNTAYNDRIDLSALTGSCFVDMNPGATSNLAIKQDLPFGLTISNQYNGTSALKIAYGYLVADCVGGSSSDTIIGNSAANSITGGGGNDTISGGDGRDTVVFNYSRSAATISYGSNATIVVSGPDGTDTLRGVERLRFSDQTLAVGAFAARLTDLSGDGRADLVWQSATGQAVVWGVNGASSTGGFATSAQAPAGWSIQGSGDFNGDGKADLLWRNDASSQTAIWLMNGSTVIAGANTSLQAPSDWNNVGVGDFNGDGKADLLWRNVNDGRTVVWTMDGATVQASSLTAYSADNAWSVADTGDFNGDGKADILWHNTSTNQNALWFMDGSNSTGGAQLDSQAPADWSILGTGDFNGDRKADILWQHAGDQQLAVWLMEGSHLAGGGLLNTQPPAGWEVAGIGDLSGDRKADLLFRNAGTGQTAAWMMDGSQLASGALTNFQAGTEWNVVA